MSNNPHSINSSVETEIIFDERLSENPHCPLPKDFSKRRLEWKEHFSRYLSSRNREKTLRNRELFSVSTWDGRSVYSFRR